MKFLSLSATLVVLALFVSLSVADDEAKQNSPKPSVTVFPDKCRFSIPISNMNQTWKWGVSPTATCEYSWMATIKSDGKVYQPGFSYFTFKTTNSSGTFAELLEEGNADLWLLDADGQGASVVEGVSVKARAEAKQLIIEIDDKEWTQRLFKDKPTIVKFQTDGTQLKKGEFEGRVQYKNESRR